MSRRHALRLGGLEVHTYVAMLYLGCVAGVFASAAVAGGRGLPESRFALVAIVLLVPAFVGARAWYVACHLDVYRSDLRRVFRRSDGGSALFGGLVLSFAASIPILRLARLPLFTFWDAASVTMLVGLILTRFGCLMNGCCAGRETKGRLGVWLPNVEGEWRRRYPSQLLESGWAALLLAAALAARNAIPFDGALFAGVVGLYCAGRLVLEATREHSHAPLALQALVAPLG